jgi:hypothetical protein
MIHRRRGERAQKGNPHQLTRDQHVTPAATLRRFAAADGLIEVHLRDKRIVRLQVSNQLFCVDRLWDQRAEAGYMKSIEDEFQASVDAVEAGRYSPQLSTDHSLITRFWSLLRWRNHFVDSPMNAEQLNNIGGENLSIDQREILERKWASFVDADGKLSSRMFTGLRIQVSIARDEAQFGGKRWGVLRAASPLLILPDRLGPLMAVVVSPRILLAADNENGVLSNAEVRKANGVSIAHARNFVVVPPHS